MLEDHKLTFIGPKYKHIEMMGNKIKARKIMSDNGVKNIPGLNDVSDINNVKKLYNGFVAWSCVLIF